MRHQQGLLPVSRSQSHAASLPVHYQALTEQLMGVGLGTYCVQSPH